MILLAYIRITHGLVESDVLSFDGSQIKLISIHFYDLGGVLVDVTIRKIVFGMLSLLTLDNKLY